MDLSGNKRRDFLKTMCLGTASLAIPQKLHAEEASVNRPNIVLIITDDQGWGDVRSHGNDLIDTPVMDRLAASGARFDRFYVSPVCAPTRASLLTGRDHLRTGTFGVTRGRETMRSEEVTIADILRQAGYSTGCFGKWHNGAHYPYNPNGKGFDEFLGFCAGHWNNYFDTTLEHNGRYVKTKGYIADVLTDAAMDFIEKNKERPFFCYVPYNPPHSPFQTPQKYFKKYKSRGLDDKLACVYAMCENLDDNIGRILNKLDELKLTDNTIIIFITDNGPNTERYNGNMRGRKGSSHEGGVRVPCFIRWQGHIQPGITIKQISAHIDLLPTIIELTGVEMPETLPLDGVSLAPLLYNTAAYWHDRMLFTHWGSRGAVRTQRCRLVVGNNGAELFDMDTDPGEQTNIAEQRPYITRKLKAAYDAWFKDAAKAGFKPIPIPIGHENWDEVILPGHEAFLEMTNGKGISYNGLRGWANDWVTNWTSIDAYPYWEIDVVRPGRYEITLMYICPEKDIGAKLCVEAADKRLEGKIENANNPNPVYSPDLVPRNEVYEMVWAPLTLGSVTLRKGRTRLCVKAMTKPGKTVMNLKSVNIRRLN